MEEDNSKQVIQKGESETVEFKESLKLVKEITQSVCAFANTTGGIVCIGISDKGKIIGADIGANTIENLANHIRNNTDSQLYPSIKVKEIQNKNIVVIEVKETKEKPVFYKKHAYKRVGKTNPELSSAELRRIAKESGEKEYFDEQVCKTAGLDDIDDNKVRWFIREAKKKRGLNIEEDISVVETLTKLKLWHEKKPTNAIMLLFSKEPWFLQAEVKCIRFSGDEPIKPYIDFQTLEGNIFDLINRAEEFIFRNIKKSIQLVPGQIQREEKYEYPTGAIREAIVNAAVHRDWESSSKIQIRIFDNRIEIWSPGLLPKGITIDDLKKEHISIPRNPLLFKQLFWIKYVEDVGGGTNDIINECAKHGIPEPEFKYIAGAFVVVLRLFLSSTELQKIGLNERQIKAIDYIKKNKKITRKEYEKIGLISSRTANRELEELFAKKIIEKKAKGPDTKYVLARFGEIWRDKN